MEPDDLVSLSGPEVDSPIPAEPQIDLSNPLKANLPQSVVEDRTERAHWALKDLSPGKDSLSAAIGRGDEFSARETAAAAVNERDTKTRIQMIHEMARSRDGQLYPEEVDLARGLANADRVTPEIVFEAEYAREYFNRLGTANKDFMDRLISEDADGTYDWLDAGTSILARGQIVDTKLQDLNAKREAMGFWDTVGTYGAQLVPALSWSRIAGAAKNARTSSFNFLGGDLQEQAQYYWTLSPKNFHKELNADLDALAEINVLDAITLAQAVRSFSSSDKFVNNVFSVLDIVDVATGVGALRSAGKAAAKGISAIKPNEAMTQKVIKDALEASQKSPERALEVIGDVTTSVEVKAVGSVLKEAQEGVAASERLRQVSNTVPSIARPTDPLDNIGHLANEAAARIRHKLTTNAERLMDAITEPLAIERLTPEALVRAAKNAGTELYREFRHLNDAVLDIRRNPRDVGTNTDSMSILIGGVDAKPFTDPDVARVTATDIYNIPKQAFTIRQEGVNHYIDVKRAFDETKDNVRDKMIVPTNETPKPGKRILGIPAEPLTTFLDSILGRFRSPAETSAPLNRQNRNVAAISQEKSLDYVREVAKDLGEIPKKLRNDFESILRINRDSPNPSGEGRGLFYKDVGELEAAYLTNLNRLPTEKEVAGYFAYVQLSDYDWMVRNLTILRDKERLGLKTFTFTHEPLQDASSMFGTTYKTKVKPFEGKEVDYIPWNQDHLSVLVYDPKTKSPMIVGRNSPAESRALVDDMVKNQGFKVVQVDSPVRRPLKEVTGTNEPVQYVVTNTFEKSELATKQLNYAPGGHVVYKDKYWVKQPKLYTGQGGTAFYEGDTTAFNFPTQAQANKFAQRMDDARLLMNAGDDIGLNAYLRQNLPYSYDSFKRLFDKDNGYFDPKQKFHSLETGQRIADLEDYASKFTSFRDLTKGEYNLTDEIDRAFAGERSMPGKTIPETGTDAAPVYDVVNAPLIDPMTTLSRSIGQITRSRYLGDMKISAAEQFVQEFHKVIDASLDDLRQFPMYYLHNARWKTGIDDNLLQRAKYTQANALTFIGQRSPLRTTIEQFETKIANTLYEVGGEGAARRLTDAEISQVRDPTAFFRNIAFKATMGFFNPIQWFVQAQGLTHITALSPRQAPQALAGYTLMRNLLINSTDEIINANADIAVAMGWKKDHFIESWQALNRSGWDKVGRETALLDNMNDPTFYEGTVGKFMDKSLFFFNGAERMIRMTGWNAAFLEWRKANPLAKLDNRALGTIMNRADTLTVNMTRASKSSLEQGVMSIPLQFSSYQARLMDQMLGKQLTLGEKFRAFGAYSFMYGVPSGAAAVTGISFYDDIKKKLVESQGWTNIDKVLETLVEGVPAVMTSMLTGNDYNIAQRYGPSGFSFVKDFISGDKTAIEIALGPSGRIFTGVAGSAWTLLTGMTDVFRDDSSYAPLLEDLIDVSRNITTANNMLKTAVAISTGKYINKNEIVLDKMTTFDAVFSQITGLSLRTTPDAFLLNKSLKDTKELQTEAEKEFVKHYRRGLNEQSLGNTAAAEAYFRRASAARIVGDFTPQDYTRLLQNALRSQETVVERIGRQWITNAPYSEMHKRFQQNLEAQPKTTGQ